MVDAGMFHNKTRKRDRYGRYVSKNMSDIDLDESYLVTSEQVRRITRRRMDGFLSYADLMRHHKWTNREWISPLRLWVERCKCYHSFRDRSIDRPCPAIRISRVNDMIYIDENGRIWVLQCKENWHKWKHASNDGEWMRCVRCRIKVHRTDAHRMEPCGDFIKEVLRELKIIG